MLCRWIVAPLVLIGLSGCALAIEPRFWKPTPTTSDAATSEPDATVPDASDAAVMDGSVSMPDEGVIVLDNGPSRPDAIPADSVTPTNDVSTDVTGPAMFPTCRADSECATGFRCCAQVGRCMRESLLSTLCNTALARCSDGACPIGKVCCDGLVRPMCVDFDRYLTACPSRVCNESVAAPLACPGLQRCCDGRCIDTDRDVRHCGRCGNTCGSGLACGAGMCHTCLSMTVEDPNVANIRCCRAPSDPVCMAGAPCCVLLPRLQ